MLRQPRCAAQAVALACAVLLAAGAHSAAAQRTSVTAYTCEDAANAMANFNKQVETATTSAVQELALTFACNGTFDNCQTLNLGYAPPLVPPRQPPVRITINAGPTCRKLASENRPYIYSPRLVSVDAANYPATRVDVSVNNIMVEGQAVAFAAHSNTGSTLRLYNVDASSPGAGSFVTTSALSSVTILQGYFSGTIAAPAISATGTSGMVTITGNIFVGNSGAEFGGAIFINSTSTQVRVNRNSFSGNAANTLGQSLYVELGGGNMYYDFSLNKWETSQPGGEVEVCLQTTQPIFKGFFNLGGAKGITPLRSPWLVNTTGCTVASFLRAAGSGSGPQRSLP